MSRPKLLDLFCGAGGCSVGYNRAGFDVVGVDINPQPNYPYEFIQADALSYLGERWLAYRYDGCGFRFDAIHASPPCQRYSVTSSIHKNGERHADLIDGTRDLLTAIGVPWVIENVVNAPLVRPIVLCGMMFGLKVLRHRLFESSFMMLQPDHPRHPKELRTGTLSSKNGGRGSGYSTGEHGLVCVAGHNFNRAAAAKAMDIDWMTSKELAQAIPPAYTEFVGRQILNALASS